MTDNFGFIGPDDKYNRTLAWILAQLPGITAETAWEDYNKESPAFVKIESIHQASGVWNTTFDDGKGTDQSKRTENCYLIGIGPEIVLVDLAEHYLMKTVNLVNPPRLIPLSSGDTSTQPSSVLPSQPSNPIGSMFSEGKYFPKRGDVSPVGSVYTDGVGNVYKKNGYLDPFGSHLWWELQ